MIAATEEVETSLEFSIFPNPMDGQLIIEVAEDKTELTIFNPLGDIVHQQQLQKGTTELDLQTLPAGMYVLRMTATNRNVVNKRMVKL